MRTDEEIKTAIIGAIERVVEKAKPIHATVTVNVYDLCAFAEQYKAALEVLQLIGDKKNWGASGDWIVVGTHPGGLAREFLRKVTKD